MVSIIIPTYNERENIRRLVGKIFEVMKKYSIETELIIVDDNSPDATANIAKNLKKDFNLKVLVRKKKKGLSSAVLDSFRIAKGNIFGVMDADFSHPPDDIPNLVKPILDDKADLVIGSRYVKGGKIKNWPFRRKIISLGAKLLARSLTPVKDPLSGFFFFQKDIIKATRLNPKGYKIGLEIIGKGKYKRILEIPYVFRDREKGESKLGIAECKDYLSQLFALYLSGETFYQLLKFCIVGVSGILVNLAVLYSLVEFGYLWYIHAAMIAFLAAVSFNFTLNKIWTFRDGKKGITIANQYLKFVAISTIGLIINLFILYMLVEYVSLSYLFSQFMAILTTTTINFLGSKYWAFASGLMSSPK